MDQDAKLRFLLLARFNLAVDDEEQQLSFSFHASIALECRFQVCNHLLTNTANHCSDVGVQHDPFGNLPLHYVVQQDQNNVGEAANDYRSSAQLLELVLKLSPEAASRHRRHGELPLPAALKSDFVWDKGIQALFHAHPDANCEPDPVTKLYPFCLAASFCHGLTASFALLRQNPEHVLRTSKVAMQLEP